MTGIARLLLWGLCAAPLAMAADAPAPRLAARPDLRRGVDGRTFHRPYDEAEWQQVQDWMEEHCPHRLHFVLGRMNWNEQQQAIGKQRLVDLYRQIHNIPFEPLKKAMISQAEAQDQVFGAQIAIRDARRAHENKDIPRLDDDLKKAIEKLIDAQVEEKKIRIQRLTADLKRLTENREAVVTQWHKNMLRRAGVESPFGDAMTHPSAEAAPHDPDRPER